MLNDYDNNEDVRQYATFLTNFAKGVNGAINWQASYDIIYYELIENKLTIENIEALGIHINLTSIIPESNEKH